MNTWHTVSIKFTKEFPDGTLKRVTEQYLVNAVSFTDAEARIHKEVGEFIKGEFVVKAIAKVDYIDVLEYDDDRWYKVKVNYSTDDSDTGKEKTVSNNLLVSSTNAKQAYERTEATLKNLMGSFNISAISQTGIKGVFPYEPIEEIS
jgi:hypothetical protein